MPSLEQTDRQIDKQIKRESDRESDGKPPKLTLFDLMNQSKIGVIWTVGLADRQTDINGKTERKSDRNT